MNAHEHLVRAASDGADRLVAADDLLARLQLRCGGEIPGTIAIPALLETVRSARRFRLRLARSIIAHDGSGSISAWVEVRPRDNEAEGCDITIRNWQVTAMAEDATEAERRRADLDRGLAEFFAQLDPGQRVLAAHADAVDLADLASAMNSGRGLPWTDFVTVEGGAHHSPMHWRLLDGALVAVSGSDRRWQARLEPRHSAEGDILGFELRLVALDARPSTARAQASAPGAVASLVSEEVAPVLRQPIARIIANAETIRARLAGPIADEYAGYAADIASAGQHLLGLLNDLGDLEVVEADDFATVAEPIDLAEVARQAAGILGVRARERGIMVEVPPPEATTPAFAEFRRVLQVLLNLLGNAIRYSPLDSRISIAVEREGDRSRATVADEGPGLSADDAARVFEKFERLGRSGDGGSGLGLYISRRLARAMGGDLHVESAPGEGARFTLELPGEG